MRASFPDLDKSWEELKPQLAITYPFELDTFQKEAVLHLEQNQSVRRGFGLQGGRDGVKGTAKAKRRTIW